MPDTFQQAVEKGLTQQSKVVPKKEPTDRSAIEKEVLSEFTSMIEKDYGIAGTTALGMLAKTSDTQNKARGINFSYDPRNGEPVAVVIDEPVIKMGGEEVPDSSMLISILRKYQGMTNKKSGQATE